MVLRPKSSAVSSSSSGPICGVMVPPWDLVVPIAISAAARILPEVVPARFPACPREDSSGMAMATLPRKYRTSSI